MIATGALVESIVEVGWAGMALDGDERPIESGDHHVVVPFERGSLVAVMDGLGHGPEAAEASREAAEILAAYPGRPVVDLIQLCHEGLRRTRGAVMTLCSFSAVDSTLTWSGVGNVDAELFRSARSSGPRRESISLRGGVVGYTLPPLRAWQVPVSRDDTLILSTDGVRSGFSEGVLFHRSPQEIAQWILDGHRRKSDDALVVVARYRGEP